MEEKHLLWDNLEILKGALLNSRKIPIAAYLNINILRNIFNDISILLQDSFRLFRSKSRQQFPNGTVSNFWVLNNS